MQKYDNRCLQCKILYLSRIADLIKQRHAKLNQMMDASKMDNKFDQLSTSDKFQSIIHYWHCQPCFKFIQWIFLFKNRRKHLDWISDATGKDIKDEKSFSDFSHQVDLCKIQVGQGSHLKGLFSKEFLIYTKGLPKCYRIDYYQSYNITIKLVQQCLTRKVSKFHQLEHRLPANFFGKGLIMGYLICKCNGGLYVDALYKVVIH